MRISSLRGRLILWLGGTLTATWLAAVLIAGFVIRDEMDETLDSALQETAQRLLPLAVADILNHDGDLTERSVVPLGEHEEHLTYLIRDAAGTVILQSHDAEREDFPDRPHRGFINHDDYRVYGEATVSGTLFIEVAESIEHRHEAALEATISLMTPLAVLLPISLAGIWWLVRRALLPLLDLGGAIEARGAGDLTPVPAEGLPDEIRPIADAVNRLMDRLHRSLETERSFTANSAHELRTPIAGALAQTQRLMATTPAGEARERLAGIESSLVRLGRIAEKLMQLARAEGGALVCETASDLAPVLVLLVDEFRRNEDTTHRLVFDDPDARALPSRMDQDAFAILVRNLIENALRHGTAGEPVTLTVEESGAIAIRNDCPALNPVDLGNLTARFKRGATAVSEGSGLGLAIARAIAEGAGARLQLSSPLAGTDRGFEAKLYL